MVHLSVQDLSRAPVEGPQLERETAMEIETVKDLAFQMGLAIQTARDLETELALVSASGWESKEVRSELMVLALLTEHLAALLSQAEILSGIRHVEAMAAPLEMEVEPGQ